jgi:serine/threonine protein kinase
MSFTTSNGSSPSEYRLVKTLGGGTYGKVYMVENIHNQRFALKTNYIQKILKGTIGSLREMAIMNELKDHPFCLHLKDTLYWKEPFGDPPADVNSTYDKIYFLMEEGQLDGRKFINTPTYGWPERKLFITQLLLAIEYIHSKGIYHRDLKPDNIICYTKNDKYDHIQVSDFGLANYYTHQAICSNDVVTLWYRAPEILLHKYYDTKSDIWSVACIIYETITQRSLINTKDEHIATNKMIELFPFPHDDYTLAQKLYIGNIVQPHLYDYYQKQLLTNGGIAAYLNLNKYQIAQFDSQQMSGQDNRGTFVEMIDLLSKLFVIDPRHRWSASQALNHPFFIAHRKLISQVRAKFGINNSGMCLMKPLPMLNYMSNSYRNYGMNILQLVYNKRSEKPFLAWYTHRILFHTIEMFDRYLLLTPGVTLREWDINVIVKSLLFISIKFFRIMQVAVGLEYLVWDILPEHIVTFKDRVITMEENILKNVFKGKVYYTTVYEIATEFLNDTAIKCLLKVIFDQEVPSGTPLQKVWELYLPQINAINKTMTPSVRVLSTYVPVYQ